MSNLVRPNVTLVCNVPAGAIRQYLWYVDTSLVGIAAQRAAVTADIAAGLTPTGYLASSPLPTLQLAPGAGWAFPQDVWAFVVAESTTLGFVIGSDTVTKASGDGW
jgi:hypothetical protein